MFPPFFTETTLDLNGHMPSSSSVKPPTLNYPMPLNKQLYIEIEQWPTNPISGDNMFLPLLLFIT